MSQAWLVASGKGGVGKSFVTSALGVSLAMKQRQTVAVDADMGLRSLDLILGLEGRIVYDVVDVAEKNCKLRFALVEDAGHPALSLLPAAQMGDSDSLDPADWDRILRKLHKRFSYILIDAPAGLERGVTNAMECSDQCLLVTTPDDVAIRDAERVVALLHEKKKPRPMLIINRIRPDWVRTGQMYSPQTIANLLDVPLLGYLPEDPEILHALSRHKTVMDTVCPAQEAMDRISRRFLGEYVSMPSFTKRRFFMRR